MNVAQDLRREPVSVVARSFGIEEADLDGVRVIAVAGELDLAVADEMGEAIRRAAGKRSVIVDLAACEFLDSTGIAVLIRSREAFAAEGRDLAIRNPRNQVLRVLEVTGLTRLDGFVVDRPSDPAPLS